VPDRLTIITIQSRSIRWTAMDQLSLTESHEFINKLGRLAGRCSATLEVKQTRCARTAIDSDMCEQTRCKQPLKHSLVLTVQSSTSFIHPITAQHTSRPTTHHTNPRQRKGVVFTQHCHTGLQATIARQPPPAAPPLDIVDSFIYNINL